MKIKSFFIVALVTALPLGCAIRKNLETPFNNPVNKPVVDVPVDATHGTKYCSPDAVGGFDVDKIALDGGLNSAGVGWADGGGCVSRPIREVWAALQNLEALKWDDVDRFTAVRTVHPSPDFTHLYAITYFKGTIIGTIDWTIQWFHGFDQGTFELPTRVNITYQKVHGTSNIMVWQGGITLSKVNDTMTSIGIHSEFKARQSNSENVQSSKDSLTELVRKARTAAPDWVRLESDLK